MTLKERLYRFRSFWLFPAIAVLLIHLALRAEPQREGIELVWLLPVGVLIWTLLEYLLHRFVFHIQVPLRDPRLRELVNASHMSHHAAPRDPTKLLVHPLYGLIVSLLL